MHTFALCTLALLVACGPGDSRGARTPALQEQLAAPPLLDDADFIVAGVGLGVDSRHVRQVLGPADSSTGIQDSRGGLAWHYRGLTVLFSPYDSLVAGLEVRDTRVATARGLRIGDSAERVRQLYGAPVADESSALQYEHPKEQAKAVIAMLRNGVVWRIYVGLIFD